jgi:hypothetical protein
MQLGEASVKLVCIPLETCDRKSVSLLVEKRSERRKAKIKREQHLQNQAQASLRPDG